MVEGAELCRLRKNRREERLWSRFNWDFSPEFQVDDITRRDSYGHRCYESTDLLWLLRARTLSSVTHAAADVVTPQAQSVDSSLRSLASRSAT